MGEFPSRDHQFKAGGPSANPAGRPKERSLRALLRELLDQAEIAGKRLPRGLTIREAINEKLAAAAMGGDLRAIAMVYEQAEGKVPDVVEGNPDRPLKIVVEYADPPPPDAET